MISTTKDRRIRELQHQARMAVDPRRKHRIALEIADLISEREEPEPDSHDPDQGALFDFDGPSYDPEHDRERLNGQIRRVFAALSSGGWMTLAEIREKTGDPEASISAQIRHLRKPKFGGHQIDKQRRGDPASGLWEYRLVIYGALHV